MPIEAETINAEAVVIAAAIDWPLLSERGRAAEAERIRMSRLQIECCAAHGWPHSITSPYGVEVGAWPELRAWHWVELADGRISGRWACSPEEAALICAVGAHVGAVDAGAGTHPLGSRSPGMLF